MLQDSGKYAGLTQRQAGSVFLGQERLSNVVRGQRPLDADGWIIPGYAAFVLRSVVVRGFIEKSAVSLSTTNPCARPAGTQN